MKKAEFFEIVQNDSSSITGNSLNESSFNCSLDFKDDKKKNVHEKDNIDISYNKINNLSKKNALKFLGIFNKKKTEKLHIKNNMCESTLDAYNNKCANIVIKNNETNDPIIKGINIVNKINSVVKDNIENGNNIYNDNKLNFNGYINNDDHVNYNNEYNNNNNNNNNTYALKNEKKNTDNKAHYNNEFYCLKQIVDNNLNNNYDKNEIKLFNIYHDNRAECLFHDISIIKFYAYNNICIYENKDYIYNEINTYLFECPNGPKKADTFNINDDIYEYLYNEKIKLKNKDKIYKENDNHNNNMFNNCDSEIRKEDNQIQCLQFYIHKYPSFLKDKIKAFIHIYNMFSIYPYINNNFIQDHMYYENIKIVYHSEKVVNIQWKYYDINELTNILKKYVLPKKLSENSLEQPFIQINDYIYINFLTQEIKMIDINSYQINNNYIILNGNGLCFSAYYHILVPHHRHINENTNDQNKNYHLSYEYVFISQLFNIYDNFHICFLYPLFVTYFFYYHLFVKHKMDNLKRGNKNEYSDMNKKKTNVYMEERKMTYIGHEKIYTTNEEQNIKKEIHTFNEKNTINDDQIYESNTEEYIKYNNNYEECYIIQLNDIYLRLYECLKKKNILENIKPNDNIKKKGYIQYLLPQSCFKHFKSIEFIFKSQSSYLFMLYLICISKYGLDDKSIIGHKTNLNNINILYSHNNNNIYNDNLQNYINPNKIISHCNNKSYDGIQNDEYINSYENLFCYNDMKEISNIRNIFPDDKQNFFNSCNKIDNIIKISIRNNGVCFFYIKDIVKYLFFSYFIIFNSMENLIQLMNNKHYKNDVEIYEDQKMYNEKHKLESKQNELLSNLIHNNRMGSQYCCITSSDINKNENELSKKNQEIQILQKCILNEDIYKLCSTSNIPNDIYNNIYNDYYNNKHNFNFPNVNKIFEMDNIKNIYNDFFICENKNVNIFKLINIMNKEKKKILTPYYFSLNELTPLFFLKLSNIHIYDINIQLNKVFQYIHYNNHTFTPFLTDSQKKDEIMNVQLDLLENTYIVNNEVYLLYIKKINYNDDFYKYNYLYVQDYLLKNYILYYNIYFYIQDHLKKNKYYKLKYTNINKETLIIHFTVSFNCIYDQMKFIYQFKPQQYITHIEKNEKVNITTEQKQKYISFIDNYVCTKCVQ
ncbi:conserved Plasmodium protein, unknown function [Plasmodium sp. gorilla clade G2]|uniref:conserved Plasmodium protein, unknown function n=1 Tax=Plasmodium sp. gorilla clade G2 TaxID=880535 RepID=UPI000D229FAC|nr:conserved Plasmodium protein, unknown function [Plasmodium sp. gorilla clade G2]SOV13558.1 conserved Plasmodium protein, unknown function [Plasmodium sp. gorilla clade G2]